MNRDTYLRNESWHGSFYEIALELGPAGNDVLAIQALRALWSRPELRGPWHERTDFDSQPADRDFTTSDFCLYGTFRLDDESEVGCMSFLIREEGGADW